MAKKNKVEEEVKENKVEEIVWPEAQVNGKFHVVPFNGGFVLFNPAGQRASGVLNEEEAKKLVLRNNQAASL